MAYDEKGEELVDEVGELVITRPMPSMPVAFCTSWSTTDPRIMCCHHERRLWPTRMSETPRARAN